MHGAEAQQVISEALTEEGINDKLMKQLAETMKPGSSALFILLRRETPDQILEELKGMGGKFAKVLSFSLTTMKPKFRKPPVQHNR